MLPIVARRLGRSPSRRAPRRPELGAPERLERRDLLAFSPLGVSLPDLAISAQAAPVATYGGPLALQIDLSNLGASSLIEPLNLAPGSPSFADAPASTIGVFLSDSPRFGAPAFPIAAIPAPALRQNSVERIDTTITLPPFQPPGFPGNGGTVFLFLKANISNTVADTDQTNNITPAIPVKLEAPLPDLLSTGLDVPPVMQPGDTIAPVIKVTNFGTVDTAQQGPVLVALVASTTPNFGPGSQVLETFTDPNIPPLADVPFREGVPGLVTINDPVNVVTLTGAPVTLPKAPATYFLGVIVDPLNTIRELHEIGRGPSSALFPVRQVGPPIPGLIPAGVLQAPAPATNLFPVPAFGPLQIFATRNQFTTTTGGGTTTTTAAVPTVVVQSQAIPLPPRFNRFLAPPRAPRRPRLR